MVTTRRRRLRLVWIWAVAATAFSAGLLAGAWSWSSLARPERPELDLSALLHATATHGNDSFAVATGSVDEGAEGLFMLDFLTGELQCLVINPRLGTFTAKFTTNVIKVLGVDQQKKPRYLMVTGAMPFPRGAGVTRPGNTVVYVVDANTGAFAAFGIPWNRNAAQSRLPQAGALTLLDAGRARQVEIGE